MKTEEIKQIKETGIFQLSYSKADNPATGKLHQKLGHSVGFTRENFESEISKIKTMITDRYPGMEVEIVMVNENTESK